VDKADMDDLSNRYQSILNDLAGGPSHLVILVDSSPLMELHRHAVTDLVEAAGRAGATVIRFAPGHRSQGARPRAPSWPGANELPREATAAVIVTDTQDRGWRQPRLRAWTASIAVGRPTALLHPLDRSAWSRGPLPPQPMRMTAAPPSSPASWSTGDAPDGSEDTDLSPELAVLPVLEFEPTALAEWIAVVNGASSWEADVCVLPPDGARPPGLLPWEPDPVSRFLSQASRGARNLAVRLAQAPVNLPVAELLQRTIPRSTPDARSAVTEIAEVLGGDLMDPTLPVGDLHDPAATALDFLPGVRRELLGRFGDLSVMRSVCYSLGIEFKDHARIFQWLARIETGAPRVDSIEGEEALARAMVPALSEMPGEYRRFAEHLRTALGETTVHGIGSPSTDSAQSPPPEALRKEPSPTVTDTDTSATEPTASEPTAPRRSRDRRSRPRPLAKLRGVPPHNLNFTGRSEILERIHSLLEESAGRVYLLAGGGGIGKTQIATEYAHRYRDDYDLIWWIPANSTSDVQQSYLRLARYLGLGEDTGNLEKTAQIVREALETDSEIGHWLLILDDVGDLDQLNRAELPTNGPGDVIITSRDQSWIPSGRSEGSVVPSLTPQESVALLRKVCPQGLENDEHALRIAERLEHLPLALAQVGAYLRDSLMSVEEFLDLLQNKFDDLVTHVEPDDQYPLPLAAAWNMQLDDLRRGGAGSERSLKRMVREFIQLCSFFAPLPLSRTLFHRARGLSTHPDLAKILGNEMALSRILRYVSRHSLAELDRTNHTFQLHVTFQTVVQGTLDDEARVRYRDLAHRLLAQSDPLGPELPQNWPEYQLLFTHVRTSEAWRSHDPQVRGLVSNVITFLVETGNESAALELADHAIEAWYDDTAQRFQIQLVRVRVLQIRGDNEVALAEAERMYAEQTDLEGPESEESLDANRARAISLTNLGHYGQALAMFEDIHRIRATLFTEDDENTLVAAHDIAACLRRLGRFQDALDLDRHTLEQRMYLFGANGIPTLRTRLSIGLSLMALSHLEKAREILEDCERRFEATEADASVHTADIPVFLSVVHRRLGNHKLAVELSGQAREATLSRYPMRSRPALHIDSVHMVNLAFTRQVHEAVELAEDLLSHMDDEFPSRHLFPWASRANAAIVFRAAGEYEQAYELDRTALAEIRLLFPDARITLAALEVNLGNDLFALGRLQEARTQDAASVDLCREALGEHHIFLSSARRNLLISRRALGEDVTGEWQELRDLYAARFGPDHHFVTTMADFVRLDTDIISMRD
jgi:tetratricopeptide (TPR) repeat protein